MHTGRLALALSGAAAAALVTVLAVELLSPAPAPAPGALPPVTADQLIASISQASEGALTGTVELDSRLGLPGLTQSGGGVRTARLWSDDHGRRRISLPEPDGERTLVDDGTNVWFWNSATRSVIRTPSGPPGAGSPELPAMPDLTGLPGLPTLPAMRTDPFSQAQGGGVNGGMMGNPVDVAGAVLAMLRQDSTVRVDPTAMVADRAAYQLVLDPVPTERTLLREVRVAVDGQTRLPLEVSVLANGSTEPALRIGFSKISFGAQDPALFAFTPAPGVRVRGLTSRPAEPVRAGERITAPGVAVPGVTGARGSRPTPAADLTRLRPAHPALTGRGAVGPGATGPGATGSSATGSSRAGLGRAGRSAAGSNAVGSNAAGPSPTGPNAAGPNAAGPNAVGPNAVGPDAVGPDAVDAEEQGGSALIGRGWDTVLVSRVRPATRLTGIAHRRAAGTRPRHTGAVDLLQRISSPISGPWGQGRLVSTPIGNAVITTDGRMATGAVPAQVLTEALTR
jgi:outer membrane lipoprotein-sorting protein